MTTRKRTTKKRTTPSRRSRSTRRTTSRAGHRRRRTPTVASSVGTAVGLLLVTTLLDASWPVRIGLVLLGVLVVGGYFLLKERGRPAPGGEGAAAADEGAAPAPEHPAAPPTAATTTTEDPA